MLNGRYKRGWILDNILRGCMTSVWCHYRKTRIIESCAMSLRIPDFRKGVKNTAKKEQLSPSDYIAHDSIIPVFTALRTAFSHRSMPTATRRFFRCAMG